MNRQDARAPSGEEASLVDVPISRRPAARRLETSMSRSGTEDGIAAPSVAPAAVEFVSAVAHTTEEESTARAADREGGAVPDADAALEEGRYTRLEPVSPRPPLSELRL